MRTFGWILLAVAWGTASTARADEWPRWRGPGGTGISTETGLADDWPKGGPKKLWSHQVGVGFSSPIGFDGKVYLFSETGATNTLAAYEADTGNVVWTQSYAADYHGDYGGTRATPTIDGGQIFTYGGGGELICRAVADGKAVWETNVLRAAGAQVLHWGAASSPLVVGDSIFVQCGRGGPVAVALDRATGKVRWASEAQGVSGYATIVLAEVAGTPQLIVFGGAAVYGMDPAGGKTIWQVPWRTSSQVNAATPVTDGKYLFVSSGYHKGCMMLELSATGAKKLWEKSDVQAKIASPVLDGGCLYANSEDRRGTIKCMQWPTGEILWEDKDKDLKLDFGGSFVRFDQRLITVSGHGLVSLVEATPQGIRKISQMQAFPEDFDRVWSTPLIYRGKLYVKGENELACYDIGAHGPQAAAE